MSHTAIYTLITVSFFVLAAAGFGVSRFLRRLRSEFDRLESIIHFRIDNLCEGVADDIIRTEKSIKDHAHAKAEAVRADVARVENFFKSHAQEVKEEANRLHAEGKAILDKAEASTPFGRLPRR